MFEVTDCVALVTGGASGIGFAIARELLLKKAKGVAIVDINESGQKVVKNFLEEFGPERAIFVKTDVADPLQLKNAFETTVKTYKQLDVVFNNAGILNELDWERSINVNLTACIRGTMLAVEEYLPKYAKKSNPIVVNTASTAAHVVYHYFPIYSASKSGIVSFSKTFGPSFDFYKIRVISFCPGLTNTPILDDCVEKVKQHYRQEYIELLTKLHSQEPNVLANHVVGLLGNAPSGSIWEIDNSMLKRLH